MNRSIRDYLKDHILIADGAMGTYYDTLRAEGRRIAEEGNLLEPELIKSVHREYLESGARLLRTNTFAVNRAMALSKGIEGTQKQEDYVREVIRTAWDLAKEAVRESGFPAWTAADIGPVAEYLFQEYEYDDWEEYRLVIDAFLECGADIFDFETFSDIMAVRRAAAYIKEKNPAAFVMASFAVNRNSYTSKGISLKRLFSEAAHTEALDSYGCNCLIGVSHMYEILKNQDFAPDKYIQVLPNSGYPQVVRGRTVYSDSAAYYGEKIRDIAGLGVNILGGCCGTTPRHIRMMCEALGENRLCPRKPPVSVYTEDVVKPAGSNSFTEKLERGEKVIAVELDPPFDQNAEKLLEGAFLLKSHGVDMITLADSPLARARADSVLLAGKIRSMVDIEVMPHIACRDRNRISMHSILLGAHINGIRNLMIVTGDPLPAGERDTTKAVFDFNSIRFMEYIRELNGELFGQDAFAYGGALNQGQVNFERVKERVRKKADAGASWFMTQPIYADEEIERIRAIREELGVKILCGIMPLVSYRNAMFIKNEMPGIQVPDEIVAKYREGMSRKEAEAAAREICLSLIRKLEDIADGFYFMTPFNRVGLICDIIEDCGKADKPPKTF